MKNLELRKLISETEKYPGTKQIPPASVCNKGFPGTFNLSFIESEWLKEFHSQYLEYDHDYIISKIQPCIRHQDWEIIKSDTTNRFRYLGVFDMADIGGVINLVDNNQTEKAVSFSVQNLHKFLTQTIQLVPDRLRITYCIGGRIDHLTKGKYSIDKELPQDVFIERWCDLGIKESQLIADDSRDTLLALNIFGNPTPWGYRNEILYEHKGKMIDVATFEYLFYRPIFDEGDKIVDLKKWEHCFSVSAVGIERLLMVINGSTQITDCDHIKPIKDLVLEKAIKQDEEKTIVLTEAARSIHRILSDCGSYEKLSKHRKQKIRDYFNSLFSLVGELEIEKSKTFFKNIFLKIAETQPYYPELMKSVDLVVREVLKADERFKYDRSRKGIGGVAQQ